MTYHNSYISKFEVFAINAFVYLLINCFEWNFGVMLSNFMSDIGTTAVYLGTVLFSGISYIKCGRS
jgi:hypothetical protein